MKAMEGQNYYNLLGVPPTASQSAIAAAYEQRRRQLLGSGDPSTTTHDQLTELEQAYAVLSDPEQRRQYDRRYGSGPASSATRRGLNRRELISAFAFAFVAVGLIVTVWMVTNRETLSGQPMGEVNRPAPNFRAETLRGGMIELEQYRGKVVLLNFWGTWCEPCKRELPALQQAYEQLASQGLMVIGINLTDDEYVRGETLTSIAAFLDQYGVTYPIALDTEGSITEAYRVFPLPTSFFITTDGHIRYVHIGELRLTDIVARFNELRPDRNE